MGKLWIALAALLAALVLGGCNTVQGLGKDLSRAGDRIEEAARGR
jgi:predicted small secreted protein